MSLHHEQIAALEKARDLLRDIINRPQRLMVRSEIRLRAASALRHFPPITEEGVIVWSKDELPRPDLPFANNEHDRDKDLPA